MNLRPALYRLIEMHALDANAINALYKLAGLSDEPPGLQRNFPKIVAVLAALLLGVGLILWIAANWGTFERSTHFALLQGWVFVSYLVALKQSAARKAMGLLAFLGTGALLAYFGQTYQTGADPWQLFALWALLTLPLAFAVRSDALWSPWALIAMTAISLWVYSQGAGRWFIFSRYEYNDTFIFVISWVAALLLVVTLAPVFRRHTGAGLWSFRTAFTLMLMWVVWTALSGLFQTKLPGYYVIAVLFLAAIVAGNKIRLLFDTYILGAVLFGLDVLLFSIAARELLNNGHRETATTFFLLALVATILVVLSSSLMIHMVREHKRIGGDA